MDPNLPLQNNTVPEQIQPNRFDTLKTILLGRKKFLLIGLIVLLIIIVGGVLLIGGLTTHKPVNYTISKSDNNKTIHVKPTDTISVSVPGSLGLQLSGESGNANIISQSNGSFNQNSNKYFGTFKAKTPGSTDIYVMGQAKCEKGMICQPFQVVLLKTHIVVDQ